MPPASMGVFPRLLPSPSTGKGGLAGELSLRLVDLFYLDIELAGVGIPPHNVPED